MNCERAEAYLSAFLDNALDPRLSQQIRAHVEDCAHCRAILDDYRSFDHLLATTARVEPDETLRARIFDSDEYRAILAARESGADIVVDDDIFTSPGLPDLPDDLPLDPDELDAPDLPDVADLPEMGSGTAEAPPGAHPFARLGSALWPKVLLPAAAVLTLTFGAALLMKQGLLPFGAQTPPGMTSTLGNPGQQGIPLAAGPRVVYLHDGILWSAPENGPGLAQPLTASGISGVTVGAWSVSPNGQLVAYLDTRSGKLHVVRSDGLSDHAIAAAVAGGLVWSPDGERLAYLASAGSNRILHVANTDGSNDVTISAAGADAASPVWSGDANWIAYAQTRGRVTSVWSYDLAHNTARSLAAQADATDAQAGATRLNWLPDAHHPAVTWATSGANGAIEGIYSASAYGDSLRQLTPSSARYSAAAFTGANGGQWLLGDGNTLALLPLSADGPSTVAQLSAPATRIVWSPSGAAAAVAHGDALAVWASSGLTPVDTGTMGITPVWSADGESLLYATDGGVRLAHITGGHVAITPVLQATGVNAVSWAPDGHGVAVVTSAGVVLIAPDGTHAKPVDRHAPDGAALVWSVAG